MNTSIILEAQRPKFDAERNRELFDKYVTPYLPSIRRRCYFFGGRRDGEDLYQEAQIEIFRYIHTYKPEYSLFYWLMRGVKFAFCAYIRKYRKLPLPYDLTECREPKDKEQTRVILSPDNYREHFSDAIVAVLEKLTDPTLRIFLMYLNGYSTREIAEVVPKEKSTGGYVSFDGLKSNIFLTREYLRRAIPRYSYY